jgi:hypothetical protein
MPTTWDPAHKNAAIALTGGNLTATSSAGSGSVNAAVYATTAISATVKQYFEITVTVVLAQSFYSVGVMNGSASLSANIGQTNGAAAVQRLVGGQLYLLRNGTNLGVSTIPQLVTGQVLRVAVDRAANKLWWAVNNNIWTGASVWFGSLVAGDDPATGAGGMDISTVTGTIYPAMSSAWTGEVAVLNAGATAFAYAVPAGFVGIDGGGGGGASVQARAVVMA